MEDEIEVCGGPFKTPHILFFFFDEGAGKFEILAESTGAKEARLLLTGRLSAVPHGDYALRCMEEAIKRL